MFDSANSSSWGQFDLQLERVGRPPCGHEGRHAPFEEGGAPQHQMRKNGLVGGAVPEALVAREDVVHEGRAAAPVAQNEDRIFGAGQRGQFVVTSAVDRVERIEHAPQSAGQREFAPVGGVDLRAARDGFERGPVGPDEGVDRQVFEFQKSHRRTNFRCR